MTTEASNQPAELSKYEQLKAELPETINVPTWVLIEMGENCIASMAQDSKKDPLSGHYENECLLYGINRALRPALDQYRADKEYIVGPKIITNDLAI